MSTPLNKEIESKIVEFNKKSEPDNYKKGEYGRLRNAEDSLLDTDHYPESPYELDKDSVRDFLCSSLYSISLSLLEKVKKSMPKVITPTVEPPPNKLSQNQIFAGGQTNMAMRVLETLNKIEKELKDEN